MFSIPHGVWRCLALSCLAALLSTGVQAASTRTIGDVTEADGAWQAGKKPATLVIEQLPGTYRLHLQLQLASEPRNVVEVALMPANPADLQQPAVARYTLRRSADGRSLTVSPMTYDAATKKWAGTRVSLPFTFWPADANKAGLALALSSGVAPKSWQGRWITLRVDAGSRQLSIWLEGRLVQVIARPAKAQGPIAVQLAPGDQARGMTVEPLADDRFLPIDLDPYVNGKAPARFAARSLASKGVPFTCAADRQGLLDLQRAEWPEWKSNPSAYYEQYDAGAPFLDDPRMPMLRIPAADYVAAHVLAVVDADPAHSPVLTLRAGRYGYSNQTVQHNFSASVPRAGAAGTAVLRAATANFVHVRVPMTKAFAQDIEDYFNVELTKEVRLARGMPDPSRFRLRPLGLPSGVRIAAITFEKSPLQMRVTSAESGHAFVQPAKPVFMVTLTNITDTRQFFHLTARATHLDGTKTVTTSFGTVEGSQTKSVSLTIPTKKRGYHDITVTLANPAGAVLLQRETSFALLPPDTRKHRATSPFGTWDFYGGHFTPSNADVLGPLYVNAGLRFGMFGATKEDCQRWGVVQGNEPLALNNTTTYDKFLERYAGTNPPALLFHEHGISGRHVTRVPDLFTDRPAYVLDDNEKKRFDELWTSAITGAKAVREKYPQAHLRLGNGTLPFKEELYRRGFPTELFDSAGNESGNFGRLPESQPPDYVANSASLWMDRQLLDAYGYKNKPVTQCYEITYPCTNPGNLTERMQADYMVRHAMHSLAWGVPEIRVGIIADVGNSYYFSNWGAAGFCRAMPELSVKPSYVAFATMTRVLDGARYVRELPLGSPSLYGLEFARPDGKTACVLWTIRGARPLALAATGQGWTSIDSQANESPLSVKKGLLTVTVSPSPSYLVGQGTITACTPGAPAYADAPRSKPAVLSTLASLDGWQVETARDPELETYDFMTPRRQGKFTFAPVTQFEGKKNVLQVTPRPLTTGKATMPMYTVLAHRQGIPVPGTPTEIGLWVNGNSSAGRMLFEFRDASGQRWISLGAQQDGDLSPWLQDWMPKEVLAQYKSPGLSDWNTEDLFGISRINFDGWRYLSFPLPGNYPGEKFPWPANSQWRWDKDGVVHYPLTFTRLIVELPEKTLHLKDFAPAPRPEIYLKDLVTSEGPLRTSE